MFYNWLVTTLCYYGLTFMATDLTGNFFSDYSLLIFVEIPAHFYCIFALDRIGRKPILSFSLILSGVCCIVAAFVDNISWLQVPEKKDDDEKKSLKTIYRVTIQVVPNLPLTSK